MGSAQTRTAILDEGAVQRKIKRMALEVAEQNAGEKEIVIAGINGNGVTVANSIADELKLHNVTAQQIRAEQLNDRYDYIVSRAVARLAEFYQWIQFRFK